MQHTIRMSIKDNTRDVILAGIFSLALHALLYVNLATTTIFIPNTSDEERLNIIWFYPALLFGGRTEPAAEERPSPAEETVRQAVPPPPAEAMTGAEYRAVTQQLPAPPVAAPTPPPARPQAREIELQPRQSAAMEEAGGEQEMKYPAGPGEPRGSGEEAAEKPLPTMAAPSPLSVETRKEAARAMAIRSEPALGTMFDPHLPELKSVKKEAPLTFDRIAPQPPMGDMIQPANSIAAPLLAPLTKPVTGGAAPSQPAPAPSATGRPAGSPTSPVATPIVQKPEQPQTKASTATVEEPPTTTERDKGPTSTLGGFFATPIPGDLKLEITAPPEILRGLKITVLFREYPKSRHNRPQSRSEAGRVKHLAPKILRTAENILQTVIEVAGEGIYEFRAELSGQRPVEAGVMVRFFENSDRARVRSMGDRKMLDNGSIARILMPECILWEDDSYFSGSMEDSDSVTKFNSETGVIWKEYQ